MSHFLTRVSQSGTQRSHPDEAERIVFANKTSMIVMAMCSVCAMTSAILYEEMMSTLAVIAVFSHSTIILMNYLGRHRVASMLTIALPSISIFTFAFLVGPDAGVQYLLAPLLGFSLLLFNRDDRVGIAFGFGFPTVCFFLFEAIVHFPGQATGFTQDHHWALDPVCFVLSAFLYRHFLTSMRATDLAMKKSLEVQIHDRGSALQRANERYEEVSRATNDTVYEWDMVTDNIYWNDKFYKTFGFAPDDQSTTLEWWAESIHPDDRDRVINDMTKLIERGSSFWSDEYRIRKASGEYIYILDRGYIKRDATEKPFRMVGSMVDVTERKNAELKIKSLNDELEDRVRERTSQLELSNQRLEREALERKRNEELVLSQQGQMLTSAKLSALGEMASGIAHEILNPITIIDVKANQLLNAIKEGNLTPELAEKTASRIVATTDRVAKIVKSMRSFSRDAEAEPMAPAAINEIIEETLELCRQRYKSHDIDLIVDSQVKDIHIQCRAVQISQILLNLLNNAHDAVLECKDKWVCLDVADTTDGVQITVTDSGSGIHGSVREKIFMPFFTTKDAGKGTGLGLSVTAGIVNAHGGHIALDTQCPNTRFIVWLPTAQSQARAVA